MLLDAALAAAPQGSGFKHVLALMSVDLFSGMQLHQYGSSLWGLAGMTGKSRHSHDQCLTTYLCIDLQDADHRTVLRLDRPRAPSQTLLGKEPKASSTHRHLGQILVDLALPQASIIHVLVFTSVTHLLPRSWNTPQPEDIQIWTGAKSGLLNYNDSSERFCPRHVMPNTLAAN